MREPHSPEPAGSGGHSQSLCYLLPSVPASGEGEKFTFIEHK